MNELHWGLIFGFVFYVLLLIFQDKIAIYIVKFISWVNDKRRKKTVLDRSESSYVPDKYVYLLQYLSQECRFPGLFGEKCIRTNVLTTYGIVDDIMISMDDPNIRVGLHFIWAGMNRDKGFQDWDHFIGFIQKN